MVANPMQKRTRNSFLLGVIITLIICAIIGVLVYFLVLKQDKVKQEQEGTYTYVYKLKTSIKSGDEITLNNVESILVTDKAVPTKAFASKIKTEDSNGKEIWMDTGFPSGYKSKLDLDAGTILSYNLVYQGEKVTNDVRYIEYNMLVLPTKVIQGDYIDIRLTFPNGQDLIVVAKKQIKSILGNTIGFEMTEGEIALMESAIVETYIMNGSKLYATQYIEPGMQEASTKTYVPTSAVQALISGNPNIGYEARNALTQRFDAGLRSWQDNEINKYESSAQTNLETKLQDEIENARKARESYLSGLNSY